MADETKSKKVWRYEISVWNWEGDVVEKAWRADDAERDALEERYADEPGYSIVIDREWEVDEEED